MYRKPNVVYILADQQRKEATGYSGNPDVKTPFLDRLKKECLSFETAVAGMPVCSPYRASLMTGMYPHTHGVIINDVSLGDQPAPMAEVYRQAGYDTAYIGKWHIDGHGRSAFIPRERRQGFDFWQVLECTHDYNNSFYYEDEPEIQIWDGYDAAAQAKSAEQYIRNHSKDKPFFLILSFGPPHNPYQTAPQRYKDMYEPAKLTLRPNVPKANEAGSRQDLAGYYAHVSALDELACRIDQTLQEQGLAENTIFIYTSDHGDMLGSQGEMRKQRPWDEALLVPFLMRYPDMFGSEEREISLPINSPDIMPTLLGLCGLDIPKTVEGTDFSAYLQGNETLDIKGALYQCIQPFGEWTREQGGKECRGIRTERYTYVRDLNGPWLLYDNQKDPYQMNNLCSKIEYMDLQCELDKILLTMLSELHDEFLTGDDYLQRWGYIVDSTGSIPIT